MQAEMMSYLVFILPAMLISFIAQASMQSTFAKYSKVSAKRGLRAFEVARRILDDNGLTNIRVERVRGNLTDHFDPTKMVIRLSDSVHDSTSIAALGVAAHEAGHAVQHAVKYVPIRIRNMFVPVTNFGSRLSMPLIMLGFVFASQFLIVLGIVLFSTVALFQLVTLPVEFNASNRALRILESHHMLYDDELRGAKKVLSAAAMTYLAALMMSLAQLLRLISGASRNRR